MAEVKMEVENVDSINSKRKTSGEGPVKKKKKTRKPVSLENKNSLQVLNEVLAGVPIEFEVTNEGPAQQPKFRAVAEIKGEKFEGTGSSKTIAKRDLATIALGKLWNINLPAEPVVKGEEDNGVSQDYFSEKPIYNFNQEPFVDFTQDNMPGRDRPLYVTPRYRNGNSKQTHVLGPMMPPEAVQQGFSQLFTNRPTIDTEKARSYPVMVLSEVFPGVQLDWVEGSGRGDRQFKVEAEVQGRRFFGEGRSKKLAKLNLAKTILLCMYDIHDFKEIEAAAKSPKALSEEALFEKKFPLTQLKELIGEDNMNVEVVQVEPTDEDEKTWHATIVVKGVAYEAVGKNRNVAKIRAAKKALDVLRPKKDAPESESLNAYGVDVGRHPTMVFYEFYRDVKFNETESKTANGTTEYHLEAEVEGRNFKVTASSKKKAKLRLVLNAFKELKSTDPTEWTTIDYKEILEDKPVSANPAMNHPIVLLLKLNPSAKFTVTEDFDCDASNKYKAVAKVGDTDYEGEGPNKRSAKTAAARAALLNKYGINPDEYVEENPMDFLTDEDPKNESSGELCDKVAKAVSEKFGSVFKDESSPKVVAAFVLAKCDSPGSEPMLEVVSIGTGTKCITGEQMDHKGQTLNDCHGEIIACRGLRQFLYDELLLAVQKKDSILERVTGGKYALKKNLSLYLFVNTAPCGDGRVFTLQTIQQGAKNKTAGLLRTKIENGQGTIPVPENNVQTADGILEGERLRTMSCSDKILKWNVLGVQGALLSYFINPIYLENIVIGLHYHYDALYRALYKRASKITNLPASFKLNKPFFGTPGSFELSRDTSKATSNSFNWHYRMENVEAVNAVTGKTVVLSPSRLCKLQFFDKYMEVLTAAKSKAKPKTYHEAKLMAKGYQKTKELFFNALSETTFGKWVGKPYEHDMFGY